MAITLWETEKECSGCGACVHRCPKQAISLVLDKCGFLMAHIDPDACVSCGLCVKICPMKHRWEAEMLPDAYALRHKSPEILANSASGGAFTAIVETIQPDVVFGAAMGADLKVQHIPVWDTTDLSKLRGSKYVQSDLNDTFLQVETALSQGQKVLYTGTPCQIAGLKAYLGEEDPYLYTCDLLCEGVQSQAFFDRYLEYTKKKEKESVAKVEFRCKDRSWERSQIRLTFANGRQREEICHTKDTPYMNSMLFQGGNRDSCYHCPYAKIPRQGDFTIGDLWGWRSMTPDWNDDKGISLMLCNTEKAKCCAASMETVALLRSVSLEDAARENPNILRPTTIPAQRDSYLQDMANLSFDELAQKWLKPRSLLRKWVSALKFKLKR